MIKKPFIFLDLDGTVRQSKSGGFINGAESIEIMPNVLETLDKYKDRYEIVGVTNQAGVAFGYKAERVVWRENEETIKQIPHISLIWYCPYHEDATVQEYRLKSLHRKPNYGMISFIELKYATERGILVDYENSFVVGDRQEDSDLAQNAGLDFFWAWDFFSRYKGNLEINVASRILVTEKVYRNLELMSFILDELVDTLEAVRKNSLCRTLFCKPKKNYETIVTKTELPLFILDDDNAGTVKKIGTLFEG